MSFQTARQAYFKALRADWKRFALELYFWLCVPVIVSALTSPPDYVFGNILFALCWPFIAAVFLLFTPILVPYVAVVSALSARDAGDTLTMLQFAASLPALVLLGWRTSLLARVSGGVLAGVFSHVLMQAVMSA